MSLDISTPFTIRYNHEYKSEKKTYSNKFFFLFGIISLIIFLLLFISFKNFPFFVPGTIILLSLMLCYVLFSTTNKKIFLGPRYLIIGKKIIYYQNITNLTIDNSKIIILVENIKSYEIFKNKFISVSTKTDKKNKNLERKFNQTRDELIKRTKSNNPNIIVEIK